MAENKQILDNDQNEACNINVNAVVGAGAGAGKTTVLKKRVAKLIEKDGIKIENLLILTFTEKAAVEMKSRIYDELIKHDNPLAHKAVADFSKAHIQTLDSYFAEIAKYGAKDFGINPDFKVTDESYLSEIIDYKAKQFYELHAEENCVQTLCGTIRSDNIATSVFAAAIKDKQMNLIYPLDFEKLFEKQINKVLLTWNNTVDEIIKTLKTDRIHEEEQNLKELKFNKVKECNFNFQVKDIIETENFINFLNTYDYSKLCDYIDLPLAVDFEDCRDEILAIILSGANERNDVLKAKSEEKFKLGKNIKAKVTSLFNLLDLCIKYVSFYEDSKELSRLLQQFNLQIQEFRKDKSYLTFNDIAILAKSVLESNKKILKQERDKYDRIMIDEFQDNNQLQCDVLLMLADGKDKLFFVGDEKQSIYAFRGADVSVFNNLKKSMRSLEIKTNYRSTPEMIAAFNAIFGSFEYPAADEKAYNEKLPCVLTGRNLVDTMEAYEAGYKSFVKTDPKKLLSGKYDFSEKAVTVALFNKKNDSPEELSARESEAIWTVNKINELHEKNGYEYKDFYILMRTTTPLAEYEKALRNAGIDYISDAYKNIFEDGPVNDIYNLLQFCITGEKSCFAKVLASPFVNYSIKQIEKDLSSNTTEEILNKLEDIIQIKSDMKNLSISELVQKIWFDTGYKLEVEWNNTVKIYAYLFDLVFEQARKADSRGDSLCKFLEHLKSFDDSSSKMDDVRLPVEAQNAVRIMTIHKSKGLENKVVFVTGISDSSKEDSTKPDVYIDKNYGASFAFGDKKDDKKSFFASNNEIVDENKARSEAELKRLAYVAFTRAKEKLYLVGDYNGIFSNPKEDVRSGTFYKLMEPLLYYYQENPENCPYNFEEISVSLLPARKDNSQEEREIYLKKLNIPGTSFLKNEPKIRYTTPSREENNSAAVNAEYVNLEKLPEITALKNLLGNDSQHFAHNDFGTLAHAFMEYKMKGEILPESMWCQVPERNQIEAICEIMADKFLEWYNLQLQNCQIANPIVKTELPFRVYDEVENKIVYGSMDLLFQTSDNKFILVDYKTDGKINTEKYKPQLALYKKAVEGMYPGYNISCYLFFLQYGKAIEITENAISNATSVSVASNPVPVTASANTLGNTKIKTSVDIRFFPSPQSVFFNELLRTKKAEIVWHLDNGTFHKESWNASDMKDPKTLRGNITTKSFYKAHRKNITYIECTIVE